MPAPTLPAQPKQVSLELPTILDINLGDSSSSQTPLYLIHPGAGVAVPYCHLPRSLTSRPIRGVSNTFLAQGIVFSSVAEAAAAYIAEIEEAEDFTYHEYRYGPNGVKSWLLGGWSYGGVVALEMAAQLIERGDHVEGVILFDAIDTEGIYEPVPFVLPSDDATSKKYDTSAADRSIRSGAAGNASAGADPALHNYLRMCYLHAESLLSQHHPWSLPESVPVRLVKAGKLSPFSRSVSSSVRVARIKKHLDVRNGWTQELVPNLEVITVDVAHDDMFSGPGLAQVQDAFEEFMQEFE